MTTTTLTRDTVTSDRQMAVEVRAKDDTGRSFTGIGVPYGEEIDLWGIRERFESGSVELDPDGVPSLVLSAAPARRADRPDHRRHRHRSRVRDRGHPPTPSAAARSQPCSVTA